MTIITLEWNFKPMSSNTSPFSATTWMGAEIECLKSGGHLPSVHSQVVVGDDDDDDDGDEEQQPHLHPQGEQDQLNAAITEDWAGWIGGSDQEMEVICFDISFLPHCRRAPGPGAMDPSGTSLTGWMDRPLTMLPLTIVLSTLLRCKIIVCCLN